MNKTLASFLLSLLVVSHGSVSFADDFSTALTKALTQIPDGADSAAMGNASTATAAFASRNPAVVAVETENFSRLGAMGSYGNIGFQNGMHVNFYSISATARLKKGAVQLIASNGNSNNGSVGPLETLQLNSSPGVELQYGIKVAEPLGGNDALYAGASYGYAESKLTLQFPAVDGTGGWSNAAMKSETTSHTAGIGLFYEAGKKLNLGALWLRSWEKNEEMFSYEGSFVGRFTSKAQNNQLRLGASCQVTPLTLIAFDYRHLYLEGGSRDDQYFAGIEQGLVKDVLYLYGGYADGGTTGGVGVYLKHGGANLAYLHRPLRALEPFFGKGDMLMASLYWNL